MERKLRTSFRSDQLLAAIRPVLDKGYKTGGTILIEICFSLLLLFVGVLEGFYAERVLSGLLCSLFAFFFALLWMVHFLGWKYNSSRLLISHTVACSLLALSNFAAMLIILFSDIYSGGLMNFTPIRHQIQVALIETCISIALFVIFGAASWTHAERVRNFSDGRRRFLFAMKALESYILQTVRIR